MIQISALLALLTLSASILCAPTPTPSPQWASDILSSRASETVNPDAVTGTKCTNPDTTIIFHDQNVAQLNICGGIAGTIQFCGGNPKSTTGSSGTALFNLKAATAGATINVSKGRWEGCVRAARAVCPTGDFTSTCVGGATEGNVAFSLTAQ